MKELINLHIGQGGIQLGNAIWQLFCLEHDLTSDGIMTTIPKNNAIGTFFQQTSQEKHNPRAIYLDLEPEVIDEVKVGMHRHLFNPSQLISGKENAANNYARGHYALGKIVIDQALDEIRKLAEKCSNFQGFVVYNSLGGGTGSGLGTLLIQRLSQVYEKQCKLGLNIFPSPKISNSCTQPYNSALTTHKLLQHLDISIVLDNQAIYNICSRNLGIQRPNYTNLNTLIAQVFSSQSYFLRFQGSLNTSINQLCTNLVPYPRLQFLLSSYSPFLSAERAYSQIMSVAQITHQLFQPINQMVKCDPRHGKFIACTMIYRGDLVPKDISATFSTLKCRKTVNFVDWTPIGMKLGINYQHSKVVPGSILSKTMRSCSMLSNTSSISEVFARNNYKFNLMYKKRAFVHWYVEAGMQQGEFCQAREGLAVQEKDYEEVQNQIPQENEIE